MRSEVITSETWYHKRVPPMFCRPCIPFYEAIYPAKLIILVVAFVLWVAGILILIGTFIACVAAYCEAPVYGSLVPMAMLLIVVGYCLFHCAWAAYLLDEPDKNVYMRREPFEEVIEVEEPDSSDRLIGPETAGPYDEHQQAAAQEGPPDPMKYGHWKFVPDSPWQNKCSRDALQ